MAMNILKMQIDTSTAHYWQNICDRRCLLLLYTQKVKEMLLNLMMVIMQACNQGYIKGSNKWLEGTGTQEEQPQDGIPTECTSPPDYKPVKVTFVLTISNHESNNVQITKLTDCTSPPGGDTVKPTFIVIV